MNAAEVDANLSSESSTGFENEEVLIDSTRCYDDSTEPFSFEWCSLGEEQPEVLGMVRFTYTRTFEVTDDAVVQLWETFSEDSEVFVSEATP